ncbi:hypothetical protein [Pseudonocardia sp. ICBG601]|uniref:SpnB-like Rossmann fold domain-containing protein n=1 Tax=Pseudonocardia sp. ICBG601 TaxID=2846759 RepID=UPI0035AB6BE7
MEPGRAAHHRRHRRTGAPAPRQRHRHGADPQHTRRGAAAHRRVDGRAPHGARPRPVIRSPVTHSPVTRAGAARDHLAPGRRGAGSPRPRAGGPGDTDAAVLLLDVTAGPAGEPVPAAVRTTCARVLDAVQAWLTDPRRTGARLVVRTHGAVATAPGEDVDVTAAAVWGLVRAAQAENPGRLALLDEPADPGRSGRPRGRRGFRRARRRPRAPGRRRGRHRTRGRPPRRPGARPAARPPHRRPGSDTAAVRPDGVVLVHRGHRRPRAVVARHLAGTRGVRHLILTGRRGPDARRRPPSSSTTSPRSAPRPASSPATPATAPPSHTCSTGSTGR